VADVGAAEVLFLGGGNTFRLLHALQSLRLIEPIRDAVLARAGYMGASAGTNMACPTLRTTNDMPIVEPESFQALGLIPFQINPHYLDPDPASTHMGETREERLLEFLEENDVPVLGCARGPGCGWPGNGKPALAARTPPGCSGAAANRPSCPPGPSCPPTGRPAPLRHHLTLSALGNAVLDNALQSAHRPVELNESVELLGVVPTGRRRRRNALAASIQNRTADSTLARSLAPVPEPGTTVSVVIATPTTGAEVAVAGCRIEFTW